MIFSILRMVFVILTPVFWILFVLQFTDRGDWINTKKVRGILAFSIISLIVLLTNSVHKLFIPSIDFVRYGRFLDDETWQLGPYYWVHLVYSYTLILAGVYFILQKVIRLQQKYRMQAIALVIGALVPLAGNIILVF